MPQRRSRGARRGSKRKSRNGSSAVPSIDVADLLDDEIMLDVLPTLEAPQQTRPTRTSTRQRRRDAVHPSRQNQDPCIDLSDDEISSLTSQAPQRRKRSQRRGTARQRPTVISLDITYSSDELEANLSDEKPSTEERPYVQPFNFLLTPSPKAKNSDESSLDSPCKKTKSLDVTEEKIPQYENFSDSDLEDDLFSFDYNAQRDKAFKTVMKEMKSIDKKEAKLMKTMENNKSSENIIDLSVNAYINGDISDLRLNNGSPPLNEPLDLDMSLDLSDVKASKGKRRKRKNCKSIRKAKQMMKKLFEDVSQHDTIHNGDIEVIASDDDEDANPSLTLLIKWESTLLRWPVRWYQKFSTVYQEVADKFNINVAQVLLCYNDKVIKPDVCPKDLKLSIGDVIEGGVQSKPAVAEREANVGTERVHSPDSIPLKVQNADRKGAVIIYIKKHNKMIELMHRYAEEKNVKLENLRFSFDGEPLNPNDTPESLDLEGNECIDVFTKSVSVC